MGIRHYDVTRLATPRIAKSSKLPEIQTQSWVPTSSQFNTLVGNKPRRSGNRCTEGVQEEYSMDYDPCHIVNIQGTSTTSIATLFDSEPACRIGLSEYLSIALKRRVRAYHFRFAAAWDIHISEVLLDERAEGIRCSNP